MDGRAVLGIIAGIFFLIQLFHCFKVKRTALKLIPIYLLILLWLSAIFVYNGVFISSIDKSDLLGAFALALFVISAFIGDVIAWITYGIYKSMRTL